MLALLQLLATHSRGQLNASYELNTRCLAHTNIRGGFQDLGAHMYMKKTVVPTVFKPNKKVPNIHSVPLLYIFQFAPTV